MNGLEGKKLLILSGCGAHCKVVEAAKEMGIHTIVADYYEPSMAAPAKQIADEQWMISLLDEEKLIEKCRAEHVDGVLAHWSDLAQLPYWTVCDRLGYPCTGTKEQFVQMTNKKAFKLLCRKNGVDVIPEYSLEDVEAGRVKFPVFVKPADSSSSKGQSICSNYEELKRAIAFAEEASFSGEILIEHYIADTNSFQVNYFFIDGTPYVIRTADGYKGLVEEKLDRVALCSVSPSVYTRQFMETANEAFAAMLKSIGFRNGPVMVQGFYDEGVFRFYDPGLRFPGVDYELIYKNVFGVDLVKMLITFALTGKVEEDAIRNENVYLDGKAAAILFPTLAAGTVSDVSGLESLKDDPKVLSVQTRYAKGDVVDWTWTTRQRLAEIDLLGDDLADLKALIRRVQRRIKVLGTDGEDMMYKPFDVNRLVTTTEDA